jgi:hypothetical protein
LSRPLFLHYAFILQYNLPMMKHLLDAATTACAAANCSCFYCCQQQLLVPLPATTACVTTNRTKLLPLAPTYSPSGGDLVRWDVSVYTHTSRDPYSGFGLELYVLPRQVGRPTAGPFDLNKMSRREWKLQKEIHPGLILSGSVKVRRWR